MKRPLPPSDAFALGVCAGVAVFSAYVTWLVVDNVGRYTTRWWPWEQRP